MTPMSKFITACVMSLTIGGELAANAATLPQLPKKQVDVTMPTVTGNTYSVTSCGTLQSTLNTAAAADLTKTHAVDILASLSCTGTYNLPARAGATGWVLVRSASYASLPAEGTRVTTSDVSNMPTFTANASTGSFAAATNANHYRLIGLYIVPNAATTEVLIDMGDGKAGTGYIIIDRCVLLDTGTSHSTARAIFGDARLGYTALIDSYCDGMKWSGRDTQCWLSLTNIGPILIRNNFLQAAGMAMMIGGGAYLNQSVDQTYLPKDITVQRNTMTKNASWGLGGWQMKTLFELKYGIRVLVEGNIFENMTYDQGQDQSYAFRLTHRNEITNPSYVEISDLTIRYNTVRNVPGWLNMDGSDDGDVYPGTFPTSGSYSNHGKRWSIHDNLVYGLNNGGNGRLMAISLGGGLTKCYDYAGTTCMLEDFSFFHNTVDNVESVALCAMGIGQINLDWRDNLISTNAASGSYNCNTGNDYATVFLNKYWSGPTWTNTWNWTNNTMSALSDVIANYPQGTNSYPASATTIQWKNRATRDYTLQAGSPAKNSASDGTDRGVNWTAFNTAQAGGSGGADLTPPAVPQNVQVIITK